MLTSYYTHTYTRVLHLHNIYIYISNDHTYSQTIIPGLMKQRIFR